MKLLLISSTLISEILSLARIKPYGFSRFDPGPGVGGHCIPIDPQYLYSKTVKKGLIQSSLNCQRKLI